LVVARETPMKDDVKDETALDRIDTVPPPAGEADPYSAPTRVGEMAASTIAAMMEQEQPGKAAEEANEGLPAVYSEDDHEKSNAATLLHPQAKMAASAWVDAPPSTAQTPAKSTKKIDPWVVVLIVVTAIAAMWLLK
jgi:hypothetical protein